MTYEDLCKRMEPYIRMPHTFKENLNEYHKLRPSAKMTIADALINEESMNLSDAYYSSQGWFKKAHGLGGMKLMLAAKALGLIHDEFYRYDKTKYDQIYNIAQYMDDDVVDSLCKAYAKQKMVTCCALSMIREKSSDITLYRGLSSRAYDGKSTEIYFNGLESYTSDRRVAEFFAGTNGWVIRRTCSIFEIFVYYTTLYRTKKIPTAETKYKIHRAREYIVENSVPIRALSKNLKINRSGCYEQISNDCFGNEEKRI